MILTLLFSLLLQRNAATMWQSTRSDLAHVLEGSFQSCPDGEDGTYGERVYIWKPYYSKRIVAEIHMGPRMEFAVFPGTVEGDRPHNTAENLLFPAYQYDDVKVVEGGRNWALPSVNLHVNVIRVPPSDNDCYSFMVLVTELQKDHKVANK